MHYTPSLKTTNSSILVNLVSRKKKDSCINKLVSITHEIYSDFDCNYSLKVRGVFLDLSKAFDKLCHDGLMFGLKLLFLSGNLLKLI